MPRLSMNELTTFRWTFEEDVLRYQSAGYQAIGVWRRKLADFGEERGAELLADAGMAVSNLLWAGGFTGNDVRSLPESLADAKAAIRTAAMLDAGCLVLYTGGRNNHTQSHARRLVNSAVQELLPVAEDYGVTLAIEPMHPACASEWTVFTDLCSTIDFVAEYDSPYLKLVYDTYHFPLPEIDPGLLLSMVPLLAVVHLGDTRRQHGIDQERCLLGEGKAQVEDAVATLLAAGYEGDFDVELMGPAIEAAPYSEILSASQRFFSQAVTAVTA